MKAARERFIPACVGNRCSGPDSRISKSVHPRVCGEQSAFSRAAAACTGSSPRVWGTDSLVRDLATYNRFIPACVGNRGKTRALKSRRTVHPRVCGEQLNYRCLMINPRGSSPRVWGTVSDSPDEMEIFRFIPACVGNRRANSACDVRLPVHPRVCGEQEWDSVESLISRGSSPRVWGTD